MKTAAQIAAILAADVEDFRAAFKMTAELFDAFRPGNVRNELIRRNQKVRRAIEALPRRVFERQPFIDKADAEKTQSALYMEFAATTTGTQNSAATEKKISEELAVILTLMDAVQAVFKSMDGDAYDRGEEQELQFES
jgi:hypothetical protein